jgi:hypothetical protein
MSGACETPMICRKLPTASPVVSAPNWVGPTILSIVLLIVKGKKKPPEIVYRYPKDGRNQDKQIATFLENRNFILEFLELNSER